MPRRQFFAVWNWTLQEWSRRSIFSIGVLLIVFAVAYWNVYHRQVKIKRYWYMTPDSRLTASMGFRGSPTYKPPDFVPRIISYGDWHNYSPVFFWPAHQIDKWLRPTYWDRPAIDDQVK